MQHNLNKLFVFYSSIILVTYPIFGVDLKFDGSAKPKDIEYDLGLAFQKYKAGSTLLLKWSVKDAGDYVCKFTVSTEAI